MLKMTGAQVNKTMFCDWLVDTVGAKSAVVRELEDGGVVVELEFYPDQPLAGEHQRMEFHINREAITKYGLLTHLIVIAAHLRDVQKAYEEKERGFSEHGI
jgi:hypothetical protein